MEAAVFILVMVALIGLIWGGVALRTYIIEQYEYDVFSLGNIVIGCAALILLLSALYVYNETQTITANVLVLIGGAVLVYIAMFVINLRRSNLGLALVAVFYQLLLTSVIVLVIAIFLVKVFSKLSGASKK